MNQSVQLDWLKHLKTAKEKKEFLDTLKRSIPTLRALKKIITERKRELEIKELKEEAYDNPAYAFKQAYINGRRKELLDLEGLLSFVQI